MVLGRKAGDKRTQQRSSRTPTLTYYRSGNKEDTARSPFKKQKAVKVRVTSVLSRGADLIFIAVLILGIIYSLLIQPSANVVASSQAYHSAAIYRQAVIKQLSGLKNRNKITFDENSLINSLKAQYPEISQVNVELPLISQRPVVRLDIAEPSLLLMTAGSKYIVDSDGRVVADATQMPQIQKLITVQDQSGFTVNIGSQIISSQDVNFIGAVIAQCQRAKVPIASLILPTKVQELEMRTTDRPYFVKFFLGGDPLLQVGQFLAARHHFDRTAHQPSQYLDIRVPGKIYFK